MNKKIYGPYQGKDGRLRVVVDGVTISYPKYLIEQQLGKKLGLNETVHHIDGDVSNNSLDNLMVIDRSIHSRQHISIDDDVYKRSIKKHGKENTNRRLKQQGFLIGDDPRRKVSRKPKTDDHKKRISESIKGRKHTEETKQKMRIAKQKGKCRNKVDETDLKSVAY